MWGSRGPGREGLGGRGRAWGLGREGLGDGGRGAVGREDLHCLHLVCIWK